jgi:hypothetical protein
MEVIFTGKLLCVPVQVEQRQGTEVLQYKFGVHPQGCRMHFWYIEEEVEGAGLWIELLLYERL